MASFNKVILVGNLTRDPEMRYTPQGKAIAKIGIAVSRTWTNEAGEKKEDVTFVDVDSFGKQAEVIGQYFKKGKPILVEGRLRLDTWDDKQTGQKRSRLGVVLESFSFLGDNRSSGDSSGGAPSMPPRSAPQRPGIQPPPSAPADGDVPPPPEDDDVPF